MLAAEFPLSHRARLLALPPRARVTVEGALRLSRDGDGVELVAAVLAAAEPPPMSGGAWARRGERVTLRRGTSPGGASTIRSSGRKGHGPSRSGRARCRYAAPRGASEARSKPAAS